MVLFEWGVMLHDAEADRLLSGKRDIRDLGPLARGWWHKAGRQVLKDYGVFPLLTGPLFVPTLLGNATANLVRNVWAFSVIFCGHFPSGVQSFTQEETADETRGEWYVRQLLGSANITGSPLMHLMTGNLSHQIEHHLFPDLPARRYPEIAPQVKALCRKHGLPYNTGGLLRQVASVWRKIFKLALPPTWVSEPRETAVVIERLPPVPNLGSSTPRPTTKSTAPTLRVVSPTTPSEGGTHGRSFERNKDTVQEMTESAATHVGNIAGIITGAVRDVTREIGNWISDGIEMREAARKARLDHDEPND